MGDGAFLEVLAGGVEGDVHLLEEAGWSPWFVLSSNRARSTNSHRRILSMVHTDTGGIPSVTATDGHITLGG